MKTYLVIFFLLILPKFAVAQTAQGGSSDGGGSSCRNPRVNQGNAIILDLALYQPNLMDPPATGSRIEISKATTVKGYEAWNPVENKSYQFALSRINEWSMQKGSRSFMYQLQQGISAVRFVVTPFEIKQLSRVYLPIDSMCKLTDLKTVALYKNGVVNISIQAWNELGIYSQAALIIHEGLRNLQISQNLQGSDQDLEQITTLILSSFDGRTRLDELSFFQKFAMNQKRLRENACSSIQNFSRKYPQWRTVEYSNDISAVCSAEDPFEDMRTFNQSVLAVLHDFQSSVAGAFDPQEKLDLTLTGIQLVNLESAVLGPVVNWKVMTNLQQQLQLNKSSSSSESDGYLRYLQDGDE